jgi:hypothetical protein
VRHCTGPGAGSERCTGGWSEWRMGGQRVRRRCVGEVEVVTERTARVGGEVRDGESSAAQRRAS